MKKFKYIFVILKERNGEYEYIHKLVRAIPLKSEPTAWVEKHITSDWYPTDKEASEGGYYYNAGELFVKTAKVEVITESDYTIMKRLFEA